MQGQVKKALRSYAEYEKKAVKMIPLNSVLGRTIMVKSDLFLSVNKPVNAGELITEMETYIPQAVLAYTCNIQAASLFRNYGVPFREEEFLKCGDFYKTYGDGFQEYYALISAYKQGKYNECLNILEADTGKLKKLLEGVNYFLADIYFKNGDLKSAKTILEKAIDQKTDEPFYYYRMALILENENKREARKYLDVAMQYWASADEDFIPLKKANDLSKRLLIYNDDRS